MNNDVELGPATVIQETAKAILVELHNLDDNGCRFQAWVPKSVVSDDSEAYSLRSPDGEFIVQRWWAEKEGLT